MSSFFIEAIHFSTRMGSLMDYFLSCSTRRRL